MLFEDFAPPKRPSLEQQRDALQKGLGRVVQWATTNVLDSESLLNACLVDQRFDRQFEEYRGEWLWNLISITGSASKFRDPLLNALRTVCEEQNADQYCTLAMHFARSGDEAFRKLLYDFVGQRQIPDSAITGEGQLLRLDGEAAFQFIAAVRGRDLTNKDWDWDDTAIIDAAIEDFGEPRVRELLTLSLDVDIRRFAEGWLAKGKPVTASSESQKQSYSERMQAISLEDAILAAQSEKNIPWLRGWGMHAQESDLETVLQRIEAEQNSIVLQNLLRVFSNRASSHVDRRVTDLCKHPDSNVQRRAFDALGQNTHPMIREFALDVMRNEAFSAEAIVLLIRNFQSGDEEQILHHVDLPDDLCLRHWMMTDLTKMLEQNETADCLKLGLIAYFHTPCQFCRFYAAKLLFERSSAPDWLADECRFDAEEDCRTLMHNVSDIPASETM